MSNLKQRVKAIQEKPALSTADTIAKLAEIRTEMRAGFERVQKDLDTSFVHVHQVLQTQAETQQSALDDLLSLIVEQEDRLNDHESRLERLERKSA